MYKRLTYRYQMVLLRLQLKGRQQTSQSSCGVVGCGGRKNVVILAYFPYLTTNISRVASHDAGQILGLESALMMVKVRDNQVDLYGLFDVYSSFIKRIKVACFHLINLSHFDSLYRSWRHPLRVTLRRAWDYLYRSPLKNRDWRRSSWTFNWKSLYKKFRRPRDATCEPGH